MVRLNDYVCLVTGASRGIGRGIALGLGECGATVYITGRTVKSENSQDVAGSLESTATEINSRGGKAISVVVDHSDERQVTELFDRIRREQKGRLDLLVNNAYSAVSFLTRNGRKAYYEIDECSPGEAWDIVNNVGLRNNYICSTLATRMMLEYRKQMTENGKANSLNVGMIVNISSFGSKMYLFSALYGIGKTGKDRMTSDLALELKRRQVPISVISLWPGLVRTEHMLQNAKEMISQFPSESPELSGRAVAALMAESNEAKLALSGQIVLVSDVAINYGIREVDGSAPTDIRSLSTLLSLGGYRIASYIPSFIRLPKSWIIFAMGYVGRQ